MRALRFTMASIFLLFFTHSIAVAQSTNLTKTFKEHFNKTVQEVHQTEDADEKRTLLNESFIKMIEALDRIESKANLSEDEIAQLQTYKIGLEEKVNELNGLDGFDEIMDEDLDDFASYSQDFVEQANRTITIGLTTALLIVIILLLL